MEGALRWKGTPERAAGEKWYLKSDLRFLGTTLAARAVAVNEALSAEELPA